jgi:hypothetical protein
MTDTAGDAFEAALPDAAGSEPGHTAAG